MLLRDDGQLLNCAIAFSYILNERSWIHAYLINLCAKLRGGYDWNWERYCLTYPWVSVEMLGCFRGLFRGKESASMDMIHSEKIQWGMSTWEGRDVFPVKCQRYITDLNRILWNCQCFEKYIQYIYQEKYGHIGFANIYE